MSKFSTGKNGLVLTKAELELEAAIRNCEVVYAADDELLLDIDNEQDYNFLFNQLNHISYIQEFTDIFSRDEYGDVIKTFWVSKSGNHHVVVKLNKPVSKLERIALQAIFGSDRKREMLSYVCMSLGSEYPSLLYRPLPALLAAGTPEVEQAVGA